MKDEEIQAIIKTNAEKGCTLLIERYANYAYVIAANRLNGICTNEDIEECVSDTFYDLYLQLTKCETPVSNLKGLVCTIAKRRSVDRYRSCCSGVQVVDSLDECIADTDTVSQLDIKETHTQLINAISCLSEKNRIIVYKRYFLGQKTGEIASAMGLKPTAVTKRLERSVEKLKQLLKENEFYE